MSDAGLGTSTAATCAAAVCVCARARAPIAIIPTPDMQMMSDIEGELSVLERTIDILSNQERDIMREVNEIERAKGVQGFTETQASLEKISEAKSAIDEEKGSMLEEISRTVTEINQAIKDRKSHLAPQIQELRKLRQQFLDLEASIISELLDFGKPAD